ncbi:PREDICTED: transmembrane protein 231-like [Atta colombica]|nr:PREDICTED: transmembrane protein 231-like [Atta colombica]
MAAIEIFSSSVTYKYKSRIYSFASIVVFLFIVLSLITPLFIIYNTGGIWIKNRMHAEMPDVHFIYKYLLLAEIDSFEEPIVCSTFTTYKENDIKDHCTIIKVRENDLNNDGQKDSLRFEAHFYTDKPVKSLRLLLFFNFQLKHLIQATIESIGVFNQILNHEVQEIRFFGDLELRQKGLLRSEGLYETYNHSIELSDYSLSELLLHSFNRKFSARITNERVTWRTGFSNDEAVVIIGELFYVENFIYYQPSMWEELKWAWIQYLSCLLVFAYVAKHILVFLFTNKYLNTYIIRPWRDLVKKRHNTFIMSTKSKEKVVAAIRKLFRSSDKIAEPEGASSSTNSPSRRLLNRHYRPDAVTPMDGPILENTDSTHADRSCFFKAKKSAKDNNECKAVYDKDIGLRRLMKEFNRIQRTQCCDSAFTVELVNDNVFEWFVRLHKIDPDSKLAADMRELKIPHILLHVIFPKEFPFAPPFMRVISPRIDQGFVMHGGAICMELLTPRGWCCAYSVESMIMQFAASVVKGQAQVARVPKPNKEYNRQLAEETFKNLVRTHEKYGWVTPPLAEG